MVNRIWLDVPYAQKDAAKAAGARWDSAAKRWYAPRPNMPALQRWMALPDVPELLPGEDRTFGAGLFVDLVPSSCWFTNVRSCVDQRDWERLRRMITNRAGRRCESCGRGEDRDARRWLEAHERWDYDDAAHIQALRRLVCLCTDCHTATHFGLAEIQGKAGPARAHLRTVTGLTDREITGHIEAAFSTWRARDCSAWALDLRILTDAGITLTPPPDAIDRVDAAEQALRGLRAPSAPPAAPQLAAVPTARPKSRLARWLGR